MSRTRRERVKFSDSRKRLGVRFRDEKKFRSEFVPRWCNDEDDNIANRIARGYEFVSHEEVVSVGDPEVHSGNTDLGSRVSRVVGRTDSGQPIRAYLMKQRIEDYQEDADQKEEQNALVDQAIRAGKAGGADIGNKYGEVKLS